MNCTAKIIRDWSTKYGPVIGLKFGLFPTVFLNDWPSIKTTLTMNSLVDRPPLSIFSAFYESNLVEMSGHLWQQQRRFTFYHLSKRGFGKHSMDSHIVDQCRRTCELMIDKTIGSEIDVRQLFGVSLANNVSTILIGRPLDYSPYNSRFINYVIKPDRVLSFTDFWSQFPNLADFMNNYLIFLLPDIYKKSEFKLDDIYNFFRNEVKLHLENDMYLKRQNDYIDDFLNEINNWKNKNDQDHSFKINTLVSNLVALFGGSITSIMQTLEWALVLLATYPDIQYRLHREIDANVSDIQLLSFDYKNQMPFTMAFIYEVMRFRSLSPINQSRWTTADIVVNGQKIPKNTQIFANLWAVDNDPNLWDKPHEFRPERFLTDNGTTVTVPEYFTPFSIGKRVCPGEVFAMREQFLYVVILLHRYHIKPTQNTDTTLDYEFKISVTPKREPVVCFMNRV